MEDEVCKEESTHGIRFCGSEKTLMGWKIQEPPKRQNLSEHGVQTSLQNQDLVGGAHNLFQH